MFTHCKYVPLEAWALSDEVRALVRNKELRLIDEFLKGKPRCSYHFVDDPCEMAVGAHCRLIATQEHGGEAFCDYHLPFVTIPGWYEKLVELRRAKSKYVVDQGCDILKDSTRA